jgi:hypothetical protein
MYPAAQEGHAWILPNQSITVAIHGTYIIDCWPIQYMHPHALQLYSRASLGRDDKVFTQSCIQVDNRSTFYLNHSA